jgi:hypothetical protein
MTLSRQGSNTYVDAQRALVNGTDGMVTLRAGDESMSIFAFNVMREKIAEIFVVTDPSRVGRIGQPLMEADRRVWFITGSRRASRVTKSAASQMGTGGSTCPFVIGRRTASLSICRRRNDTSDS